MDTDIVEELKRGAELEEEYDADGIVRIGYKRALRYRAADEIERLRELVQLMNRSRPDAEIERLREEVSILKEHVGLQYAAEQAAEIEWLRELLLGSYRFIPRHEGMEQCDCIVCQLRNRVREALGGNDG